MKIATWNVNSVRARKDVLLALLAKHEPDVLCLQETKVIDEDFPSVELLRAGYRTEHRGQRGYNGVAILTRKSAPSDVCIAYDDGEADEASRLIAASYGGVRVICVYVPNGAGVGSDKYHDKLRWLARLRAFLDKNHKPTEKLVLCGDFNVAPEDRDIYDAPRYEGELMCSDLERKALKRVLDWGLSDSFRLSHPETGHYTWWDYRAGSFQRNQGFRIDHIYVTRPLVPLCVSSAIDSAVRGEKTPSDHAPVFLELKP